MKKLLSDGDLFSLIVKYGDARVEKDVEAYSRRLDWIKANIEMRAEAERIMSDRLFEAQQQVRGLLQEIERRRKVLVDSGVLAKELPREQK